MESLDVQKPAILIILTDDGGSGSLKFSLGFILKQLITFYYH
jgi:hypothetical protein